MLMESLEYWAKSDLYAGRSTFKLLVEDISKDTSRPVPPTVVPADVQKIYNLLKWRVPQNDCEDLDLVGDGPIGESDTPGPEVPALQEIRKTIQSAYALRSYWRAHRREPFPWLSILTSTIVVRSPANVRLGQLITRYDYDYVRPYGPGQSPQLKQDMVGVAEFMALRRMPPRIPSRTTTTEPQRAEDMDENRPESAGMYSDGASAPTRHYVLRLADSQVNTSFGSKTSDSSAPEQSVPGVSLPLEAMTGGRVASEYGGDEQARTSESPGHSWEVPESTEDSTDPHADNDDVTMEDDTSSHQGNCLSAASLAMLAGEDIEVLPALDQHITPLPGYILNDPLLPVICIADENNLVPLVLAALHQRLVLCYEVPVVGIMYSAATEACQVMIGWPIVGKSELHVAVGDPGVAAERALGVFDLDSIAGSYALARFVYLAADNLCKLDWNERASRHLDDLPLPPWRADAKLSQTYQHDKQGGSRFVERWLHSVSLLGEGRAVGDVGTSQHDTATFVPHA
ncbi:hypothetical protein C8Q77DRAFT_1127728 [Trametes polyzona]|nr:hypothetical protein C8Q77DRAFT_1127728 [Trametes polyzona]